MTVQNWWLKRAGLICGLSFLFFDVLIYSVSWLNGSGYVEVDLDTNLRVSAFLGRTWDVLHAPVNQVFGPLIFPYYRTDSDDLASLWSMRIYVLLCLLQMFVVGFVVGVLVRKILTRVRRRP